MITIRNQPSKTLEQNQRLSKSLLWRFQRNFFDRQGVEAWNQGTVPHYITSNPFIANAYAKVIFGFLRDCHAYGLDPSQPVYIMELGAGSGRFAYHFLKKFFEFFDRSPLKHIWVKYVMTDFAERNLEFWRSHPLTIPTSTKFSRTTANACKIPQFYFPASPSTAFGTCATYRAIACC